jgi:hypothetical protein
VPEQIIPEETGLLVEPGTETELAEALARLIDSSELRQRLGEAGRARLEAEFAVEHTVKPLYDAFTLCVKPAVAPAQRAPGYACLLQEWPATEHVRAELRQLTGGNPDLPIYTVCASGLAVPEDAMRVLPHLQFLPDAMVLEGEWQQERAFARQMETWRVELGQKLSSQLFLQTAREALYLRKWIARDRIRHLHAPSSRELLCAWLLHRLSGVTYSVTVGAGESFLPRSIVAKLASSALGIRVATEDLATEFSRINPSADPGILERYKPGRALTPEWLRKLSHWSA